MASNRGASGRIYLNQPVPSWDKPKKKKKKEPIILKAPTKKKKKKKKKEEPKIKLLPKKVTPTPVKKPAPTPAKKEPIYLQSPEERARIEQANKEREEREALGTQIATGLAITTGGMALGAAAGLLAGVAISAIPTAAAGTKVGSILHTASIHHWSKSTGMLLAKKGITLSKVPIIQTAGRVGQPVAKGITQLFKAGANVAINSKTIAVGTSAVSKHFGVKAMAIFGAWATSVYIGKYALSESPEPIMIPLRDAIRIGEETGDWSIYDEALEAAKEVTNPSIWEQIALWSPFSVLVGAAKKLKGALAGIKELEGLGDTKKKQQEEEAAAEPEETFEESSKRLAEERREVELAEREEDEAYYAGIEERKQKASEEEREEDKEYYDRIAKEKRELELEQRAEDERYYAGIREEEKVRKEEERIADEEYWAKIYAANEARKSGQKPATVPDLEPIKEEKTGEPLTPEEKQVISDWNAGKSALNFLWLGL